MISLLLKVIELLSLIDRKTDHVLQLQHELEHKVKTLELGQGVLMAGQKILRSEANETLLGIQAIYAAVVPSPVASIKLLVNHKEISKVDISQGQSSLLTAVYLDADGNPTVPPTPVFAATDLTDFSLVVASDSSSATLTSTADGTASTDVTVSVTNPDGSVITSNVVEYDNVPVVVTPPPANPVATIQLIATTPAAPSSGRKR